MPLSLIQEKDINPLVKCSSSIATYQKEQQDNSSSSGCADLHRPWWQSYFLPPQKFLMEWQLLPTWKKPSDIAGAQISFEAIDLLAAPAKGWIPVQQDLKHLSG